MKSLVVLGFTGLLFSACVTHNNMYQWDGYESVVYESLEETDARSHDARAKELEETIEKSKSTGKLIPPGLYAQLGYHYYQSGDKTKAIAAFESEKNLFPESSVFIDRLLKTEDGNVKKEFSELTANKDAK